MIPILIVTDEDAARPSSHASSLSPKLAAGRATTLPNWRDRVESIAPRRPAPHLRVQAFVLAGCAALVLYAARSSSAFTSSFDLNTVKPLAPFRPLPIEAVVVPLSRHDGEDGRSAEAEQEVAPRHRGAEAGSRRAHGGKRLAARSVHGRGKCSKGKKSKTSSAAVEAKTVASTTAEAKTVAAKLVLNSKKTTSLVSSSTIATVEASNPKKETAAATSSSLVVNPKKAVAAATSTSSTTAAVASASQSDTTDSFYTASYSGVATHFPGSSAALACGDVYDSPATTKFAALCHSTFDIAPGTTATDLINENKSPVCGAYVAGRKSLTGAWLSTSEDASAWVTVGGDGAFSCVGTAAVQCHIPRTISITYGSVTVSGVKIVDRNQGIGASPCAAGDVDVSDLVYLTLGKTTILSSELKGVTWVWEN